MNSEYTLALLVTVILVSIRLECYYYFIVIMTSLVYHVGSRFSLKFDLKSPLLPVSSERSEWGDGPPGD